MKHRNFLLILIYLFPAFGSSTPEDTSHGHSKVTKFDPAATAIHHISDANVYTLSDGVIPFRIPLPTILYSPTKGWDLFFSNKFHAGEHEDDSSDPYRGSPEDEARAQAEEMDRLEEQARK